MHREVIATAAMAAQSVLRAELVRIDATRAVERDALAIWQNLICGRWSIVEHFEWSGRYYFVVRENDSPLQKQRALSAREREVWSSMMNGESNKVIAFSLGISLTATIKYLRRARRKLGDKTLLDALLVSIPLPPVSSIPSVPQAE